MPRSQVTPTTRVSMEAALQLGSCCCQELGFRRIAAHLDTMPADTFVDTLAANNGRAVAT